MPVRKYYITYGSSEAFPYQGGYSLVHAKNRIEACQKHNKRFGFTENGYGRYCRCYTEEEFKRDYPDGINVYQGLKEVVR
jgi:hypothetical protein